MAAVRRVACDAQHLEPATRAMVRAMRYTGVGCVDAKWDSDGLPKVCARVYPLVVPVTWHIFIGRFLLVRAVLECREAVER